MVSNDELIQKLNQITEIATERQKAADKIIKDHEKWERKIFKRIFKKVLTTSNNKCIMQT